MIYFDNLKFDTELKYEVYLLNKYLTKHYNSETSKALMEANNSDLDELARALGEIDIEFFSLYFMSDTFVVKDNNFNRKLAPVHYEMLDLANDMFIRDKFDKACALEPRGTAKTTIFDMTAGVYLHCYKKSKFTLLGAKTDDDSTQFLSSIKKQFNENKKIRKVFGKLINPKAINPTTGERYKINANEVEFTNGTYIRVVGSGTSVRGANWNGVRPTVVIGDDFQDKKNILTEDSRNKQYNKWMTEVEEVGDKAVYRDGKKIKSATKIIFIGTVMHIDCLASKLSRNTTYHLILRRAIPLEGDESVDDIFDSDLWKECHDIYYDEKIIDKDERQEKAKTFYEDHKKDMEFPVLWSEKWSCFELATKYWEDRESFFSEYQNDASSIGEKWFKSVRTQTKEEIEQHDFTKTMLSVDPASTTNKKSDSTNIMVGSKATNDFTYIRDIVHRKMTFNQYCEKVVEVLERNLDATHINVEKNTYQGADVIKIKELIAASEILKGKKYEWINEMQKKNKDEKISTIVDAVNNGQIIIVSDCEDSKVAIEEIEEFQGQLYSVHDDAPDNLAELENKIKTIQTVGKVTILDRRKFGL